MSDREEKSAVPSGHPLAVDRDARSASRAEPGFLSPPAGAPVYHGFEILADVVVDGFTFGKVTDFEIEPCSEGDAFVIAPDNSRAGLVWEVSQEGYFREVLPMDPNRWGVWGVCFPLAMTSRENVKRNLEANLPELRKRWQQWLITHAA